MITEYEGIVQSLVMTCEICDRSPSQLARKGWSLLPRAMHRPAACQRHSVQSFFWYLVLSQSPSPPVSQHVARPTRSRGCNFFVAIRKLECARVCSKTCCCHLVAIEICVVSATWNRLCNRMPQGAAGDPPEAPETYCPEQERTLFFSFLLRQVRTPLLRHQLSCSRPENNIAP